MITKHQFALHLIRDSTGIPDYLSLNPRLVRTCCLQSFLQRKDTITKHQCTLLEHRWTFSLSKERTGVQASYQGPTVACF